MPHSAEERKRVITRLRRIKGQTEALERAVDAGTDCGELLQQLAALRGATYGLMADVLESHMRETFGEPPVNTPASVKASRPTSASAKARTKADATLALEAAPSEVDRMVRMMRSFLR
jgi:FrmR/RcnR family transcriptional regulator, repressor of frmRAB operon